MNNDNTIDFYFSYRSPYSYLILTRMLRLKNEHQVEINFKIVYPLAIRMPEWFKNKNIFFFIPFIRDFSKKAKKLNIPLKMPIKPDPIVQNTLTGKISSHQPYIFDICLMGQFMCNQGKGIEFAHELSTLIWSVKNWNKDQLLGPLFTRFDENLLEVREYIKVNETKLVKEIEMNQADQKKAGHHGVPLNVYKGKYYFGQDEPFDQLIDELIKDGIIESFK